MAIVDGIIVDGIIVDNGSLGKIIFEIQLIPHACRVMSRTLHAY